MRSIRVAARRWPSCEGRAQGRCSTRVKGRPYWKLAREELGLVRDHGPCGLSVAYQAVRNLAAIGVRIPATAAAPCGSSGSGVVTTTSRTSTRPRHGCSSSRRRTTRRLASSTCSRARRSARASTERATKPIIVLTLDRVHKGTPPQAPRSRSSTRRTPLRVAIYAAEMCLNGNRRHLQEAGCSQNWCRLQDLRRRGAAPPV
jgi:hypothetical protein